MREDRDIDGVALNAACHDASALFPSALGLAMCTAFRIPPEVDAAMHSAEFNVQGLRDLKVY